MMVNCPKCGFSQPEDQYCASCGVNMVQYRPKPVSLVRRLATNTVFQMASVSIAIFIAFIVVRERNHKDHLARLELAQQSQRFAQERELRRSRAADQGIEQVESPAGDPAPPIAEESAFAPPKSPPPVAVNTQGAAGLVPPAAAARGIAPTPSANLSRATQVRISFIEGQRPMINELMANASQVAIAGTLSVGVVTGIQARLTTLRNDNGWRPLESSAFQDMKLNQPSLVFKGLRDPASGANLGFTVQVIPNQEDDQGTFLQVDVLRVLRDTGTATEDLTFPLPEGFTVPKGGAVVIAGALPHRQLHEGEGAIYGTSTILRIMSGESFRSGNTDAVILIETK